MLYNSLVENLERASEASFVDNFDKAPEVLIVDYPGKASGNACNRLLEVAENFENPFGYMMERTGDTSLQETEWREQKSAGRTI